MYMLQTGPSDHHTEKLEKTGFIGCSVRLGALVCVAALSLTANAADVDAGKLYLELRDGSTQFRWGDRPGGVADAIQTLRVVKKCEVAPQQAGDADLVTLAGGALSGSNNVGLIFGSLGVASSKGVGCGRLESRLNGQAVNQSLNLSFAGELVNLKAIQVALDLELKGDVRATMTTRLAGGQTGTWTLLSGGNAIGMVGCDAANGEICEVTDANILCNSTSDSGSDSGGSDNCRVTLNVEADGVFIEAQDGAVGVEGGGDSGTFAAQFDLVSEFEGELDCLQQVTVFDPADPASLVIRRLANLDASQCDLIPYNLDFDGGEITFQKLDLGQLVAHSLDVHFGVESIDVPGCYPSCPDLGFIPGTVQQFEGAAAEIPIPMCVGTPVFFTLAEAFDPDTGDDLVGQLKTFIPPAGGWMDLDAALPGIQHGCWYDQAVEVIGPDPANPGTRIVIKVHQKIYLLGDWAARRTVL